MNPQNIDLTQYRQDARGHLVPFGKNIRRLWFACLAGVLLIPSQEVLHKLF